MNDKRLDELLKGARVPERTAGHWQDVPKKISAKLRWQERAAGHRSDPEPRRGWLPFWGWGLAGACVAGLLVVSVWKERGAPVEDAFAGAEKCYREIEEMFPNQVRAIVLGEDSSRLELAETADMPDAPPIFLRICGPGGCETVITFSGQRIRVGDEECDVLANGSGGVIVAGEKSVWTSEEPAQRVSQCRIEARQFKPS